MSTNGRHRVDELRLEELDRGHLGQREAPRVPVPQIDLLEVLVEPTGWEQVRGHLGVLRQQLHAGQLGTVRHAIDGVQRRHEGRPAVAQEVGRSHAVDPAEQGLRGSRHVLERRGLEVEHVPVELRRPPHGLARVVHDEVEAADGWPPGGGTAPPRSACAAGRAHRPRAGRPSRRRPAPGCSGAPHRGNRVVTMSPAPARSSLMPAWYPIFTRPPVSSATRPRRSADSVRLAKFSSAHARAQLVVEVVDLGVLLLADVAVLLLAGAGVGVLREGLRGEDVRRHEHRPGPQSADARLREHALVALHLGGLLLPAAGLGLLASSFHVGRERVARRVQEPDAFLWREAVEQRVVGRDGFQQLGGRQQHLGQVGLVAQLVTRGTGWRCPRRPWCRRRSGPSRPRGRVAAGAGWSWRGP